MKIVVTHASPDLDAITSVWLIKRFLPDWHMASVEFVPAGTRTTRIKTPNLEEVIEKTPKEEIIHVDTGLGPLDHHQTNDQNVCGASRTWDYVKEVKSAKWQRDAGLASAKLKVKSEEEPHNWKVKSEALDRIVKIVVDYDHFREVFWENPSADYYEFSLYGILEGLKIQKPDSDDFYAEFVMSCLDAILHNFETRIWAEKEIADNSIIFETRKGKGLAVESLNDMVVKLAQKTGYEIVLRKDPRKGYVRIKALPARNLKQKGIDLTLLYAQLSKMDPDATWFLHVSKKMLLNGSVKNPAMRATKLSLEEIINVIKTTV